jgi:P-type Ca2+ transporter type 2C
VANIHVAASITGLSLPEIQELRKKHGYNVLHARPSGRVIHIAWDIVREPMFMLLVVACTLYFLLGETGEGILMLVAMIFVSAISLYQETKSSSALKALQQYTEPAIRVIRNNKEESIYSRELVPGDIILLEEGMNIPADAVVLRENDLTVNESIITGESIPVDKHAVAGQDVLLQGTTLNSGKCIAQVTATGNSTVLGKLGKEIEGYHAAKTLLQLHLNRFVKQLALFGFLGFLIIFLVNYFNYQSWASSLLFALTLAMSVVPEEIPVAFSSFMALGAYKMSKLGIISRQPQVIENLGAVSVICLDKTGTITENRMTVKAVYNFESDSLSELPGNAGAGEQDVLISGALASEQDPFDAMEKAIWEACRLYAPSDQHLQLTLAHEYPLEGIPPMMTHVYTNGDKQVVAGKGAVERVVRACRLDPISKQRVMQQTNALAGQGYRVIAVAAAETAGHAVPPGQDDFNWHFKGLLALYDPPKKNIPEVISGFYNSHIAVKLLTGDYPETAMNIGGKAGILNEAGYIEGEEVMKMTGEELGKAVQSVNIFARMYPAAKLKVIDTLKANGEIVAMTGDGVNDGPALKSASIGIAMGRKGTEIARQAADLIITDDNLDRMTAAIREGRKIFANLKKAIRYIISIHVPIIITAAVPVILDWAYPNIFTPIHVIFMELIMGPTCSIFFEKEPVEENIMQQPPRKRNEGLFTSNELLVSIIQGIVISAGVLGLYYYFMNIGASLEETRNIVFTTLILSNVFLTFVNRSFSKTIIHTSRYKNALTPLILVISCMFLIALHFIPFVGDLFRLAPLTHGRFWLCLAVAFAGVMWFELYKAVLTRSRHAGKVH